MFLMAAEVRGDPEALRKSYNYVRTAMVALLVGLAVAVFFETARQGFFLASVSAYYYTPAQAMFVGSLVGLGACMIALRGTTEAEDLFLNLGGMFAAVVAIVPTSRGEDHETALRACRENAEAAADDNCLSLQALEDATAANVENNVTALLILGALGLVATAVIAWRSDSRLGRSFWVGFPAAVAVLGAGAIVFLAFQDWFIDNAHIYAAIGLSACVLVVVCANAFRQERERPGDSAARPGLSNFYVWLAVGMVAVTGTMGVLLALDVVSLFWLEIVVALLFIVFWVAQTIDRARVPRSAPAAV
jgi:hypothetical protein